MRILVPATLAAAAAAVLPVVPASAAHCSCRTVHRAAYAPVRHHVVRRVAYVRPVVRRVVYRPRIVEMVRPVYRPVVYRPIYRPLYRPIHRVWVEPMWRPRPVFYHAGFAPRPWHRRWEGRRFGYGGDFHRRDGWR
jgi:hypothetical protein